MTNIISDQTLRYNAKDCHITYECYEQFFADLKKPAYPGQPDYWETYRHTISLYPVLIYMMSRGVKVDLSKLSSTRIKIEKRLQEILVELKELAGQDLNPNSNPQLQQYFYVKKGVKPYTKLNDKKEQVITTDDKALQRLARGTSARPGFKEAKLCQEFRKLNKLKGTYLDITFDADNRLRCSYNPRGTKFGRLSSSKTIFGTGMNMQNLPETFLEFMVADDNCFFMEFDKRQAEWIAVAYASGEENMISAVERGVDVHVHTAANMFKVDPELIILDNKLVGHESDPTIIEEIRRDDKTLSSLVNTGYWLPRTMSMRQCGKKSNHGLNYDERYKMFALMNEISEKEAKVICDFYHGIYPGLRKWYDYIKNQLNSNGRVLTNLFGRPHKFLGKWGDDLWKSAYAFIPQSTVAETVNRAMAGIYYSSDPALAEVEILQQVHDSILFQATQRDGTLGPAVRAIHSYMDIPLTTGGRTFTIPTDLKVGYDKKNMVSVALVTDAVEQERLILEALNGCQRSW